MKQFEIPPRYRSHFISQIKQQRKAADKLKKDFSPTALQAGDLHLYLSRHFGFCYGVENAIEIAFRTIAEHPDQRIFLLSEMIHNPQVNADLQAMGVQFLQDNYGKPIIPLDSLEAGDIVLIPAFGTTLEMAAELKKRGIETASYNTTCPFVEKVWNRGEQIAKKGYSLVIHGKPKHEETRATFSHASANTPSVVVNDLEEAKLLGRYITGEADAEDFYQQFGGRYSQGFHVTTDLQRIGVINQTTQLATDTQAIADYLRDLMTAHFQLAPEQVQDRFADTRDTLCYATNDNQQAVYGLLAQEADFALVVGGYNSSNTSHLVELCEAKLPTYFIESEDCLKDDGSIEHCNWRSKEMLHSAQFLPTHKPLKVLITSGASCPDAVVERVIRQLARLTGDEAALEAQIGAFNAVAA